MQPNPLSLDELFSRDPLKLTNEDIDLIVQAWSAARERWTTEEKVAKASGRKPKLGVGQVNLGDLELEI